MTSLEQAKRIYEVCVASARNEKTLTYGDVLNFLGYKLGVSGIAIRYGLELTLITCADLGLPQLTSIVVNEATGRPSEGGHKGIWEEEVQNVFNHQEWPNVDEIDWKYTWDNRKTLSDQYGTPGYWG